MDRASNALTAIKDAGTSAASTMGGFLSSTADSGVIAFKGTSLGESFFKNLGAIMIVVFILLGGIFYIDLASEGGGPVGAAAQELVERKVIIEPNTAVFKDTSSDDSSRVLPTDVAWTAPLISMRNEMKEAFGTPYSESQLDKIQTMCSDSFCVMHNKSPAELERACNSITTKKMCGTKCCCGWAKYTGFEGDNDPSWCWSRRRARRRPVPCDARAARRRHCRDYPRAPRCPCDGQGPAGAWRGRRTAPGRSGARG